MDGGDEDAGDLDDKVAIALALDAHDGSFTTIIQTALDTDLIAYVQTDLVRTEIGDPLFIVFSDSNEVVHGLCRDGQVVLATGESGALEIDHEMGIGNIVLNGLEGALDKDIPGEGRDQDASVVALTFLDVVLQGNEASEAITTGVVTDFQLVLRACTAQDEPDFVRWIQFAHRFNCNITLISRIPQIVTALQHFCETKQICEICEICVLIYSISF